MGAPRCGASVHVSWEPLSLFLHDHLLSTLDCNLLEGRHCTDPFVQHKDFEAARSIRSTQEFVDDSDVSENV